MLLFFKKLFNLFELNQITFLDLSKALKWVSFPDQIGAFKKRAQATKGTSFSWEIKLLASAIFGSYCLGEISIISNWKE